MSRTIKDLPFWLWQHERLGITYPPPPHNGPWGGHPDAPDGNRWTNPIEWSTWYDCWHIDPAVHTQKARRRSNRADRRLHEGRYRAYVRDRLRHGDWDDIEPPQHLTGYSWWW